ncbi:hypothetical protein BOX15_Mlig024777g2, partial [Macrostomum lignano]
RPMTQHWTAIPFLKNIDESKRTLPSKADIIRCVPAHLRHCRLLFADGFVSPSSAANSVVDQPTPRVGCRGRGVRKRCPVNGAAKPQPPQPLSPQSSSTASSLTSTSQSYGRSRGRGLRQLKISTPLLSESASDEDVGGCDRLGQFEECYGPKTNGSANSCAILADAADSPSLAASLSVPSADTVAGAIGVSGSGTEDVAGAIGVSGSGTDDVAGAVGVSGSGTDDVAGAVGVSGADDVACADAIPRLDSSELSTEDSISGAEDLGQLRISGLCSDAIHAFKRDFMLDRQQKLRRRRGGADRCSEEVDPDGLYAILRAFSSIGIVSVVVRSEDGAGVDSLLVELAQSSLASYCINGLSLPCDCLVTCSLVSEQ